MKKYLIVFAAVLSVLFMTSAKAVDLPEKTDHEKVTIHLFWWTQCGHCHDLITWFSTRYADYTDYFEFVTYEITDDTNSTLMGAMQEYHSDITGGVPLVIIGDEFHQAGFGNDGTEIIEAALKEYQNENYKDIVKEAMAKNSITPNSLTFEDAAKEMGVTVSGASVTNEKSNDGLVIGIIFGVLILGFGGLVVFSRKK